METAKLDQNNFEGITSRLNPYLRSLSFKVIAVGASICCDLGLGYLFSANSYNKETKQNTTRKLQVMK